MKRDILTLLFSMFCAVLSAQVADDDKLLQSYLDAGYKVDSLVVREEAPGDKAPIITNPFAHNFYVYAEGGLMAYRGDFSHYGPFGQTLSGLWFVGVGKWFTPFVAMDFKYGMSKSRGFMDEQYPTPYIYGDLQSGKYGNYWRTTNKWIDLSADAIINISRLIAGYEGVGSDRLRNQFMGSVGVGYVHHYGYTADFRVADEVSAHLGLQYSHFFGKKRQISLDIKARGILYQTNFDMHIVHKGSRRIDANYALTAGLSFHFKHNGWYERPSDEQKEIYVSKENVTVIPTFVTRAPEYGEVVFYVFYPNNYSGKDDAPNVSNASVNAIDYLAGGLYTQKRYKDTGAAQKAISAGGVTRGLEIADIPTDKASRIPENSAMVLGYEMGSTGLSLPLDAKSMNEFHASNGYYYAPVWDGRHNWQYRIDKDNMGQTLMDAANYKDDVSFGLNSNAGRNYVCEYMLRGNDENKLYSFADVYAALEGNSGYVSTFSDKDRVAKLMEIFSEGVITNISVVGSATSQNNNTADVGMRRNSALSQDRANTVLLWLKGSSVKALSGVQSQIIVASELDGPVKSVKDSSTRGLDAKMNRYVKVTITYMLQ